MSEPPREAREVAWEGIGYIYQGMAHAIPGAVAQVFRRAFRWTDRLICENEDRIDTLAEALLLENGRVGGSTSRRFCGERSNVGGGQ